LSTAKIIEVEGLDRRGRTILVAVKLSGRMNERVAKLLRRGQCHALAVALHEVLGWPVVACYRRQNDRLPIHYCVRSPDTFQFADVQGLQGRRCEFTKHASAKYLLGRRHADWLKPNMELARHFAPLIAADILKQERAMLACSPVPEWTLCRALPWSPKPTYQPIPEPQTGLLQVDSITATLARILDSASH
jgi:hypothetical protein